MSNQTANKNASAATTAQEDRSDFEREYGVARWWAKDGAWHIAIPDDLACGDLRYTTDAYPTRNAAISAIHRAKARRRHVEWIPMADGTCSYRAEGGKLICPAHLGGCGLSEKEERKGQFWWHAKETSFNPTTRGYCLTLREAKEHVEKTLSKYFEQL